MSGATRPRILPPPPRRRDWWLAGVTAGALLGAAELVLVAWIGPAPPERLALALGAGSALLVALPCLVLGVLLRLARRRPPHAALVGCVLGAMLAAPVLGGLLATGTASDARSWLALAFAVGAGGVAARLGANLEAGGLPLPGISVLAIAALLVAAGETASRLAAIATPRGLALAGVLAIAIALAGTRLALRGVRHRTVSPARWTLGALGALSLLVAAAFASRVLPWLVSDGTLPAIAAGPPNLLLVDLGTVRADEPAPVGIELLASEGVPYTLEASGERGASESIGAGDLLEALAGRGYAAGAILRDPDRAGTVPVLHRDVRPGAALWLAQFGHHVSAGPVFRVLPSRALERVGLGGRVRAPGEIASDARGWLVRWRMDQSHSPFALLIDFSDSRRAHAEDGADLATVSIRNLLRDLGVDTRTLVFAAVVRRDPNGARVEAALSPPAVPGLTHDASDRPTALTREALASALLALADLDEATHPTLPGVVWRRERTP